MATYTDIDEALGFAPVKEDPPVKKFKLKHLSEAMDAAIVTMKAAPGPKIKVSNMFDPVEWPQVSFGPPPREEVPPSPALEDIAKAPAVEKFPISIEDRVMDIIRHNRSNLYWAVSTDTTLRSQGARQIVINILEQVIEMFLAQHSFDKVAACIAFFAELKANPKLAKNHNFSMDTLVRNPHNLRYYVKNLDAALEKVLLDTPLTPANLARYLQALTTRVKDVNSRARERQPKITRPKKGPYGTEHN